jgi:hypothetical protein
MSNRDDPALVLALGSACEKAHLYPVARAWYNLAVERDPLDPDAQKALFRLKGSPPAAGPVSSAGGR